MTLLLLSQQTVFIFLFLDHLGNYFILTCYLLGDFFVKIICHRLEVTFFGEKSTCFCEKARLLSIKDHFSYTHSYGFSVQWGRT